VALVVDDVPSVQPFRVRCVEIRGRAEAVAPPNGDQPSDPAAAVIRVHPERIISFGIDEPDQEPHQMTVNRRNVGTSR
jgi:pyridoxamine 5'-phosphate oxidase family protein